VTRPSLLYEKTTTPGWQKEPASLRRLATELHLRRGRRLLQRWDKPEKNAEKLGKNLQILASTTQPRLSTPQEKTGPVGGVRSREILSPNPRPWETHALAKTSPTAKGRKQTGERKQPRDGRCKRFLGEGLSTQLGGECCVRTPLVVVGPYKPATAGYVPPRLCTDRGEGGVEMWGYTRSRLFWGKNAPKCWDWRGGTCSLQTSDLRLGRRPDWRFWCEDSGARAAGMPSNGRICSRYRRGGPLGGRQLFLTQDGSVCRTHSFGR